MTAPDLSRPRHPLPEGASITPDGQRPDADPSLAVRNNGGSAPSAEPAPAGRREALLVLSFGGPEGHDDVMPFLLNVTRGRGIPPERLEAVAEHYHHFAGVSPINGQNKALIAAVEAELAAAGIDLPVYWGNRNWAPYVEDTWRQMAEDGIEHAYVFATSAYASFSGCRQYHEDVARAGTAGTHPAFVRSLVDLLVERRAGGQPRLGTDCPASCCFVARP